MDEACWGWQGIDTDEDGFVETGRLQVRHPLTHVVTRDEWTGQRPDEDARSDYLWDAEGTLLLEESHTTAEASWSTTYTYSDTAVLLSMTDWSGAPPVAERTTTFAHDAAGRPTERITREIDGTHVETQRWFYDATGLLVAREWSRGDDPTSRVEYTYDELGRVVAEAQPGALPSVTYTYEAPSFRLAEVWSDCEDGTREVGAEIVRVTDADGRPLAELEQSTDVSGEANLGTYGCGAFDVSRMTTWTWDEALLVGHRYAIDNQGDYPYTSEDSLSFEYDASGNLLEGRGWVTPDLVGQYTWTWSCPEGSGLGTEPLAALMPR